MISIPTHTWVELPGGDDIEVRQESGETISLPWPVSLERLVLVAPCPLTFQYDRERAEPEPEREPRTRKEREIEEEEWEIGG